MDNQPSSGPSFAQNYRNILIIAAFAALVFAIYYKAFHFGFIDLDDNEYVFNNSVIQSGMHWATVKWAFTTFHAANWHPLTWLSHALDVQFFGINPGAHHAVNIILHLINTVLVYLVFSRMTGRVWASVAVAGLFAAHPAHVESVVWIAERKDVLSTMFWLLTMLVYLAYARDRKAPATIENEVKTKKGKKTVTIREPVLATMFRRWSSRNFLLVLLFFTLGLLAKPMVVTLPFVLLLCDYWPLEDLRDRSTARLLVLEKLPLFVLVVLSSIMTVMAQKAGGAVQSLTGLPFGMRLVNTVISYAKYVVMMFYPTRLTVLYPYPASFPWWQIVGSLMIVVGITLVCLRQWQKRKYLLVGWLWFLGTLVPVIGLVQVGTQPLADRYTYVPYLGLFVMLVWGVADLFQHFGLSLKVSFAVAVIAVGIFGVMSFRQTRFWSDDETAYRHALAVTQRNYAISYNMCHLLMTKNHLDEAEPLCRDAIAIEPNYVLSYNTLGIIQLKRKLYVEAIVSFKEALRRNPAQPLVYSNLSVAQSMSGDPDAAEASLQTAVEMSAGGVSPTIFAQPLGEVIVAYSKAGNDVKVAENLQRLLYLTPENTTARKELAQTLYHLKRWDEAQAQIQQVIGQTPNDPEAHNIFGLILLERSQRTDAIKQFEQALRLDITYDEAAQNLTKARNANK